MLNHIKKIPKEEWECRICNGDGLCLSHPSHPNYEYDYEDSLRYFNCWNYLKKKEHSIRNRTNNQSFNT